MFNRRLNVSSSINKIFIKALAISCGSVKLLPLSKILDGPTLDNFLKRLDSLYLSVYPLRHLGCFENYL